MLSHGKKRSKTHIETLEQLVLMSASAVDADVDLQVEFEPAFDHGEDIMSGADDLIAGSDGDDWISGSDGNDSIYGHAGNDEIYAPIGTNIVDGGSGIDTLVIYEGNRADYSLERTVDGETIMEGPGLNGNSVRNLLTNIERISFNDQVVKVDSIPVAETPTDQTVEPGSLIVGSNGNDWITGSDDDDVIDAKAGNDEIYAPIGTNVIDGGSGIDTLVIYEGDQTDYVVERMVDGEIVVEGPGLNVGTVRNQLTNIERISFNDQVIDVSEYGDGNNTGETTLTVVASGSEGGEEFAVKIDGEVVGNFSVTTTAQTFTIDLDQSVDPASVRVEFTNDRYDPEHSFDRNLIVEKITINEVDFETANSNVFSTGTFTDDLGIRPGFHRSETLHANGYFQFGLGTIDELIQLDGTGNNIANPEQGSSFEDFIRLSPAAYEDGLSSPSLADNPNAREISNAISAQSESIENDRFITSVWFQWGQFLDHDITRAFTLDPSLPKESFEIDEGFGFTRSIYNPDTGTDSPREQFNHVTSFIDGSVVYGSDSERSSVLREFKGGRLDSTMTESGELLPFNTQLLENEGPPSPNFFVAGDVRANENITLTATQTLFLREHNRLADELAQTEFADRDLTDPAVDEEIFQRARQIVMGLIQNITYNEFLPSTLGFNAIPTYQGYDPTVDTQISNEFTTAIYRIGHTTLPNELLIGTGDETVDLTEAFMNPNYVIENGIDDIFAGSVRQKMEEVDNFVVDGVRNLLNVGPGGFDLVARNIQRGRDHGLPDYNTLRTSLGLDAVSSFHDVISDADLADRFTELYGTPDNADPWIVAISEDHVPGASVGETIYASMVDQFTRLRDGDRFYFENHLDADLAAEIKATRLSDIIERNTDIQVQDEVFWTPDTIVFRNGLDNEWLIRDFGDNGGAEVVFFGEAGIRDPNNRTETSPVQRDTPVNAVIVAGINEQGDGFFIPNALVASPLADEGIDEFVITADIDFFEGYGLGGNDRWVIENDAASVFASGDDGDDVLEVTSAVEGAEILLLGGPGYDEITVDAPNAGRVYTAGGEN